MNEVFDKDMAVFSGLHTFHNIAFRKDLKDVDYAVVGVPFDTAAANRCGARFAPMAIRSFASFSNGYGWNTNLEVLGEDIQGTDLGEIAVKNGYTTPSLAAIETGLKVIYDAGVTGLVLGGGQLVTLGELRALKSAYGKMALIHLTNDRSVTEHGSFVDDGNVILNAVKEDLIDVSHSIQLGVRGGYNSKEESTLFLEQGMKLLSAYEMHKLTLEEICTIIKETVSDLPCIISLDMGFLDPTNAPAVDNPKIGGFTTYDLRTILRDIIPAIQMKSFDLVNLTYMFDSGEITSQAADGILTDVVCSLAKKKVNGGN